MCVYIESGKVIEKSFSITSIPKNIVINLNYCAIILACWGVINNEAKQKIQERSLLILFDAYKSNVHDLLDSIGGGTLP